MKLIVNHWRRFFARRWVGEVCWILIGFGVGCAIVAASILLTYETNATVMP